jgi:hypothetical protein
MDPAGLEGRNPNRQSVENALGDGLAVDHSSRHR